MAFRAPQRPEHKVSQDFNDGIVRIYSVEDEAEPGYAPVPKGTFKVLLPYAERALGIRRYYEARQNQTRVERVIRVQTTGLVSNLDLAVTEDLTPYRIDLVQFVPDVYPPCTDLTLVRYEQGAPAPKEADADA